MQGTISYGFFSRESGKPFVFENPHRFSWRCSYTKCDTSVCHTLCDVNALFFLHRSSARQLHRDKLSPGSHVDSKRQDAKTRQYKSLKGLKKENLRDNMSTLELVLNMLAEATTTEISKAKEPETFEDSRLIAEEGGSVAGEARRNIEQRSGRPVITQKSAVDFTKVLGTIIETDGKKGS